MATSLYSLQAKHIGVFSNKVIDYLVKSFGYALKQNKDNVEGLKTHLKVRSALKIIAKSCHICRRHNAKPDPPLMASLPHSRLQDFIPLFYNTGVDYFGPLLVKKRRSTVKRYGCLFTCLVTRAVHLEDAHSLETDSFIMALRRMMAKREKPRNIYSDNVTNFAGADEILRSALIEWTRPRSQTLCHKTESSGSSTLFLLLILGESGKDLSNQQRKL